jgi:hypothetical protein
VDLLIAAAGRPYEPNDAFAGGGATENPANSASFTVTGTGSHRLLERFRDSLNQRRVQPNEDKEPIFVDIVHGQALLADTWLTVTSWTRV